MDLAIPYIYSYRAGADMKDHESADQRNEEVEEIEIDSIKSNRPPGDPVDVEQLSRSIASQGLLQPIIVVKRAQGGLYDLVAGHLRFEACKRLGWRTIPAIARTPARRGRKQARTKAQILVRND